MLSVERRSTGLRRACTARRVAPSEMRPQSICGFERGGKMRSGSRLVQSIPLPVQTGLDHRGGLDLGECARPGDDRRPSPAPLFPPAGTFEALGGREAVARLVDGLYDRFETDPILRPVFSGDLTAEREKVKLFFEAWFGGAPTYFDAEWSP